MTQGHVPPLAVNISIRTRVHDDHVEHHLELAESRITVSIDRDASLQHQVDLMAVMSRLAPLMERLWEEQPEDGDLFLVDLRRAVE